MTALLGGFLGVLVAAGCVLAVMGLTPHVARPKLAANSRDWRATVRHLRAEVPDAAIGAAAGLLLGLVLQLPALAVVGALIGLTAPPLFRKQPSARAVVRGEAIETWVRGMAGLLVGGIGLEEAIRSSLPSTPPPIRPEVARLVARLQAQQPVESALRLWAEEMNDRTADLVAGTLIMGAETRRGGMAQALRGLTESLAEENRTLRRIEADRAGVQMSARLICVVTLGMLVFISTGPFGGPYRTPLGQVVLVLIGLADAALLRWMQSLISLPPRPLFLTDPATEHAGAPS